MEKHLETQPFMSRRTQHFLEGEQIYGSIIPGVFCAAPLLICELKDVQIVEISLLSNTHFSDFVFVFLSTKKNSAFSTQLQPSKRV